MTIIFTEFLDKFARALEQEDAAAFAALFNDNGTYDDYFYGLFTGPAEIKRMLTDHFLKDGTAYHWTFQKPVFDGTYGYASYHFSFLTKSNDWTGPRVLILGAARFKFNAGLVISYNDWADCTGALSTAGRRSDKLVAHAVKWHRQQHIGEEARRHLRYTANGKTGS
ncbi:MAG: nuclear transport factor 2 family protein [Pseudomonadota bacterium]